MNIGIIGAGMIGLTVGRLWVAAGHDVRFGSRDAEALIRFFAVEFSRIDFLNDDG